MKLFYQFKKSILLRVFEEKTTKIVSAFNFPLLFCWVGKFPFFFLIKSKEREKKLNRETKCRSIRFA